ncbi:MAG: MBL fold metallo-hydrolase [Candidatus Helarchaeota archaeon]
MKAIGNLKLVNEKKKSRFPASRTIFIDDKTKVIIDPGADEVLLKKILKNNPINIVFNSHYHYDHISNNFLFQKSKIFINEIESSFFIDRSNIPKNVGVFEVWGQKGIDDWLKYTKDPNSEQTPYSPSRNHKWYLSTDKLDGTYQDGQVFDFGSTEMKVISTPGHSKGFCCFLFPNENAVYTGDIDLTSWGPWYHGSDSDIDDFISSSYKIAKLNVDFFITAHEIGVQTREEFNKKLKEYLKIIDKKDSLILEKLREKPLTLEEIRDFGLLYGGPQFLTDPWVFAWETVGIKKHIERLQKNNKIVEENGKYYLK